jgi:hypothetical protein
MAKKQFQPTITEPISPKRMLGAVIALVLFFLLLMSVIRLAEKYFAIKNRSRELAQEQVTLANKQKDLTTTNAFLATPEGTETSLRERYDYVKPGEQMIIITPTEAGDSPTEAPTGIVKWWDELLEGLGLRKEP